MSFGSLGRARFRQTASIFDKIFDKEDLTIEEILDHEDDAIAELKISNERFLDYLDESKLEILIEYAIREPSEELDPKNRYKYPFVASELLSSGCHDICNRIIVSFELLSKFFGFLDTDNINLTSSGYFSKVAQALLADRHYEIIRHLHDQNILDNLIKHLHSKSIADFVEKLISSEEYGSSEFQDELFEIIEKILHKIGSENSIETVYNASELLLSIISKKIEIKN